MKVQFVQFSGFYKKLKCRNNSIQRIYQAYMIGSHILLSKNLPVGERLFEKFGQYFGDENCTYSCTYSEININVTDDVKRLGVIDNYSAFKAETALGNRKTLVTWGQSSLKYVNWKTRNILIICNTSDSLYLYLLKVSASWVT